MKQTAKAGFGAVAVLLGSMTATSLTAQQLNADKPFGDKENQQIMATHLVEQCQPVINDAFAIHYSTPAKLAACTLAFQKSVGYYVKILNDIGAGYAAVCQTAASMNISETANSPKVAEAFAQAGWACLAAYGNTPQFPIVTSAYGIDARLFEMTTVVPYCVAYASGRSAVPEMERSGCMEGFRRLDLAPI